MADAIFDPTTLLRAYPVVLTQAVVWGDMDANRHVNNIVYFRYFENARIEYLQRVGWLEEGHKIWSILGSVQARFRRPVTYPDTIAIGARVTDMKTDRFTMEHAIASAQWQSIVTEGSGVMVAYDYAAQKAAPIPEELRQAILALEAAQR